MKYSYFKNTYTNNNAVFSVFSYHDFTNEQHLNVCFVKNEHRFCFYNNKYDFSFCIYVGPVECDDEQKYVYKINALEYKHIIGTLCLTTIAYIKKSMEKGNITFSDIALYIKRYYDDIIETDNTLVDYGMCSKWLFYLHHEQKAPTELELYVFFKDNIGSFALLSHFIKWDTVHALIKDCIYYAPDILAPNSNSFPILSKVFRNKKSL